MKLRVWLPIVVTVLVLVFILLPRKQPPTDPLQQSNIKASEPGLDFDSESDGDEEPELLRQAQQALDARELDKAEALFKEAYEKYPDVSWESSSVEHDVAEGLAEIECSRQMPTPPAHFQSAQAAFEGALAAVRSSKKEKILALTGCVFLVGYTESDNAWRIKLPSASDAIIRRFTPLLSSKWKVTSWSTAQNIFYETNFNGRDYVIEFDKTKLGWRWIGFYFQFQESDQLSEFIWSGAGLITEAR